MNRVLIILFLLLISMNIFASEKMATWEFYKEDNKERGGRYTGPGIAYLDLINCSVKMELLNNEYIIYTYGKSGGLMLIHPVGKRPRNYTLNLGLGCYVDESLNEIKKDFTDLDGGYGMSETHRKWGEDNDVKVGVKLFNGKTWQGVGNTADIVRGEHPARDIFICLFSTTTKTPQALCNGDAWNFPFKPKDRIETFKYITDIFERITFIDRDQLPPDSPAIPPKPVDADSPAASQISEVD